MKLTDLNPRWIDEDPRWSENGVPMTRKGVAVEFDCPCCVGRKGKIERVTVRVDPPLVGVTNFWSDNLVGRVGDTFDMLTLTSQVESPHGWWSVTKGQIRIALAPVYAQPTEGSCGEERALARVVLSVYSDVRELRVVFATQAWDDTRVTADFKTTDLFTHDDHRQKIVERCPWWSDCEITVGQVTAAWRRVEVRFPKPRSDGCPVAVS